ncbi:MAG: hypothetical protein RIR92_1862, partial [Pseudomonadota bacterium]
MRKPNKAKHYSLTDFELFYQPIRSVLHAITVVLRLFPNGRTFCVGQTVEVFQLHQHARVFC